MFFFQLEYSIDRKDYFVSILTRLSLHEPILTKEIDTRAQLVLHKRQKSEIPVIHSPETQPKKLSSIK